MYLISMENHVTNLELSKKLKELGVKQRSTFYWHKNIGNQFYIKRMLIHTVNVKSDISAFTASELGEILPKRLIGDHPLWYLTIHCNDNYYNVGYETFNGKIEKDFEARDKNMTNAMAKMLIYLIEQKLLPVAP